METGRIARALARTMGWSMLGAGTAAACQPQDIYLFDPAPPVSPRVDAGTQPAPEPTAAEPDAAPLPVEQPDCTSAACTDCVDRQLCAGSVPPSVCHPFTGLSALASEPGGGSDGVGCPPGEHCAPMFAVCVACVNDADCGGALPSCDVRQGRCVECVDRGDCSGPRPVCDATNRRCVECLLDADCAATGEVCLAELARCVQCRDNSDCPGRGGDDDNTHCLAGELRCVECADDRDCGSDPEKPFCSSELECKEERE
jgi:hypothetical protein